MLEHGRIGTRQLSILIFMMVVGDMMLIYPSVITSYAKQDAWICALIGVPLGMALVLMFLKLSNLYPEENLIQISRSILGFWPGSLVSGFYLFFFVIGASTHTREVGDFLTSQIFQYTPIRVIILMFVITVGWGLYHGLETMGRSSELLMPILIVFILVLAFCLLPQVDPSNLKPATDTGVVPILQGILISIIYPVGELIPIMMIVPYTLKQAHRTRDVLVAAGLGNLLLAILVTISLLVLGAFLTQHNIYASFILSQKINIGGFFERIEAIMASSWLISTYVKAMVYMYAFIVGCAELFKLKQYRILILPASLLIFGLANLVSPNLTFIVITVVPYWVDWDTTLSIILPGLLLMVHMLKKRWKNKPSG
ncbi:MULTISPECIES: GerAB/ArcD/ProY family transporter [Paenibacillus]|uniref:Spore germination protein KB n=1 Tax=Paenibacillus pabuli TaxID=1472 RepID=A0A855Y9P8_9BACL|nr:MULTISPECIES: endospore germination permease [Paenibacillus]PWW41965.1 spore germination protein KB [Paenibacillus pabuli]PXW07354.1 spore germination protein KB [Paenibacillus taichungensis]RAI88133.1 spore germination protein KB [Paenibacillus pabuli]